MTDTPAVRLRNISKSYGAVRALRDVSLDVDRGEVLGLVGENGAGKSTLIGVLSGSVRPESGELLLDGRTVPLGAAKLQRALGVSVVVQEQALVESMAVYENIYLGREAAVGGHPLGRARRLRQRASALLDELGIPVDAGAQVGDLSFAQRQMVEIAKAFAEPTTAVVLLDEPTSALREREVEILFDLINRWRDRVAFIFVSHILGDVLRICSRLAVLRDGQLVSSVVNDGLTTEEVHELMVGTRRAADYYCEGAQLGPTSETPVLELRGATVAHAFENVDLAIRPGEVVGVSGVVGSGADAVLAALAGERRLDHGEVRVCGAARRRWSVRRAVRCGVLYVPPERARDSVLPTMAVRQNMSIGFLDRLRSPLRTLRLGAERRVTGELAGQLRIKARSLDDSITSLSGGNQQKAVLARWRGRSAVALILNDPTRGIDVGTRHEIYGLIRELAREGKAVVLFGESIEEVIGMSDRVVTLRRGRVTAEIATPPSAKPDEAAVVREMV